MEQVADSPPGRPRFWRGPHDPVPRPALIRRQPHRPPPSCHTKEVSPASTHHVGRPLASAAMVESLSGDPHTLRLFQVFLTNTPWARGRAVERRGRATIVMRGISCPILQLGVVDKDCASAACRSHGPALPKLSIPHTCHHDPTLDSCYNIPAGS